LICGEFLFSRRCAVLRGYSGISSFSRHLLVLLTWGVFWENRADPYFAFVHGRPQNSICAAMPNPYPHIWFLLVDTTVSLPCAFPQKNRVFHRYALDIHRKTDCSRCFYNGLLFHHPVFRGRFEAVAGVCQSRMGEYVAIALTITL